MNAFLSNCAQCGVETEITRFADGFFLCDTCSKQEFGNKKSKSKDAKHGKKGMTRKSLRFLGKPRVIYSKQNSEIEETKAKDSTRVRVPEKQVQPPYACSVTVTSETIYHAGIRWRVGDIVGLRDSEDGRTYYAQIRGFLQDQYCEKSACLTWLLPTADAPEEDFDPDTYILGPEEEVPRKMDYMEFICHAPSIFYQKPGFYPGLQAPSDNGFIWTKEDSGVSYKIDECKKICEKPRFVTVVDPNDEKDEELSEPVKRRGGRHQDEDEAVNIGDDYRNPNFQSITTGTL